MPAFMKFYGLQPSEFWRLEVDELQAMGEWMHRYQQAEREASR